MALTLEQIDAHIEHYNVFRELPREVMSELFEAARTVAAQASPEKEDVKPKRTVKAKEE